MPDRDSLGLFAMHWPSLRTGPAEPESENEVLGCSFSPSGKRAVMLAQPVFLRGALPHCNRVGALELPNRSDAVSSGSHREAAPGRTRTRSCSRAIHSMPVSGPEAVRYKGYATRVSISGNRIEEASPSFVSRTVGVLPRLPVGFAWGDGPVFRSGTWISARPSPSASEGSHGTCLSGKGIAAPPFRILVRDNERWLTRFRRCDADRSLRVASGWL